MDQGRVLVLSSWEGFDDLGRRFAETEFITCMALIVQRFRVELKPSWTERMAWDVLNGSKHFLTLQPVSSIPLIFKRR